MFSFPILEFPLRSSDVEVIAIPAACLVNDLRPLITMQGIVVWKERFRGVFGEK